MSMNHFGVLTKVMRQKMNNDEPKQLLSLSSRWRHSPQQLTEEDISFLADLKGRGISVTDIAAFCGKTCL
jgi:hypothetical protein